jgi:hypothetical protein
MIGLGFTEGGFWVETGVRIIFVGKLIFSKLFFFLYAKGSESEFSELKN